MGAQRGSGGCIKDSSDLLRRPFELTAFALAFDVENFWCSGQMALGHRPVDRTAQRLDVTTDRRCRNAVVFTKSDKLSHEGRFHAGNDVRLRHPTFGPQILIITFPYHH
ncbi:hypothetical protein D3Y57_01655 (plasmid) [Sphingomonas paeninsulae]|uniref:Uncharacterized protein n=1 Tax=Sphingomonas paeninsulae TaxID=2319844 RepID=A0A494TG33_SPHPE|nr:hypothetical protein D3Y57_01655 [Sphingomonas paeninsulae]